MVTPNKLNQIVKHVLWQMQVWSERETPWQDLGRFDCWTDDGYEACDINEIVTNLQRSIDQNASLSLQNQIGK